MDTLQYSFRRVHPRTLIILMIGPIVPMVFLYLTVDRIPVWIIAGYALLTLSGVIVSRFGFFKYAVSANEIAIHSGIFNRVRRNIPADRIQNVALERNLMARVLGLTAVKIETAGSMQAEGVLEYVSLAEANRIRMLLRSSDEPIAAAVPDRPAPDYALSGPQVILSGMYTFSLVYFVVAMSIVGQLEQFGVFSVEALLSSVSPEQLREVMGHIRQFPLLLLVPLAIGGLLLGWISGIVIHVIRYFGFRLELRPKKIHRQFGLFTLRETSIPFARVQTLVLRSNPLMRLHNRFRLALQTLAFDNNERGLQLAIPLARLPRLLPLARRIHDFTLPQVYNPVSTVSIRRMALRYTLALGIVVAPVQFLWSPAIWGLVLLPGLWMLAWLQYLCHDWSFSDGHLFIRRGVFWQKIWVVPAFRFQAIQTSATWLQRRLGICQLTVDTAGAGAFQYPRIVDIPTETARDLIPTLYNAFQAEMAAARRKEGRTNLSSSPDYVETAS